MNQQIQERVSVLFEPKQEHIVQRTAKTPSYLEQNVCEGRQGEHVGSISHCRNLGFLH